MYQEVSPILLSRPTHIPQSNGAAAGPSNGAAAEPSQDADDDGCYCETQEFRH